MNWNTEHDAMLRQMRRDGFSFGVILDKFLALGLILSRNSLIGRANRLHVVAPQRFPLHARSNYHQPKPKKNGHKIIASGGALSERLARLRPAAGRPLTNADPAAGEFLGIALIDLTPTSCRYPEGEEPVLFCGQPRVKGSPYCCKHHKLCFYKGREP